MNSFKGQTLSWELKDGVIELALHRQPCNEIGSLTLEELEKFASAMERMQDDAHALILYSTLKSGFCAGADLRELYQGAQAMEGQAAARGVREFLEACFTAPPTIHHLARQFGINRNKLCTGFHLLYGTTVYDFCRELRLQKAQQLLADPRLSLTDIAFSAGFGSASAFSTAFARHFGAPPSQFRAS